MGKFFPEESFVITKLPRRQAAFTLIELLVVIAIFAILIGLLVPAVQQAREAAARSQCANNLKQLGLALHNYHDQYKGFPPANLMNAGGTLCWTTLVLPYIEQEPLYNQYHLNADWSDAANDSGLNQTEIQPFVCPSAPVGRVASKNRAVLDYPACTELTRPNPFALKGVPPSDPTYIGVLGHNVRRRINEILDGSSNTLLLAEDAGRNQSWEMGQLQGTLSENGAWANPANVITVSGFNPATASMPGPVAVNGCNSQNVYSFHPGLANAVFADGSVRTLSVATSIDTLIALTTRAGGEIVAEGSY
jgi:prepilin-type N-terminal cleavage/methylation domain-containing protein/prepilin-type processing-associated H-X9-DG protein